MAKKVIALFETQGYGVVSTQQGIIVRVDKI
jgi:hypothetical protein